MLTVGRSWWVGGLVEGVSLVGSDNRALSIGGTEHFPVRTLGSPRELPLFLLYIFPMNFRMLTHFTPVRYTPQLATL